MMCIIEYYFESNFYDTRKYPVNAHISAIVAVFSETYFVVKNFFYCHKRQHIVNFFRTLFAHFLTVVFNVYSSMEYTLKITEYLFSSIPTKGGRR